MTREELEDYIESYTGGDLGDGRDLIVMKDSVGSVYSWNGEPGRPSPDFLITDTFIIDCMCPFKVRVNYIREPYKAKKFIQEAIFTGEYDIDEYIDTEEE